MIKHSPEKNIARFNKDAKTHGRYIYTKKTLYSAKVANHTQSDAIHTFLRKYFPKNITILDVGCGDGTYSLELLRKLKPKKILGFDPAFEAIRQAKRSIKEKDKKKIAFKTGNIYHLKSVIGKKNFNVAIVRGVLHHLYDPKKAIRQLSNSISAVIILEPNGYNPILKVIEKLSPYHKAHEEKSYFPPQLNSWFIANGYSVIAQEFVGVIPYFFPSPLVHILKFFEPLLEKIPFLHIFYTGTNIALYKKNRLLNTSFSK